jgi:hypothetical protein
MAPPAFGRRTFTKVIAGTAVAGFSLGSRTWVADARRPPASPFENLPRLDGSVVLDDAALTAAGQDVGQIVFERPLAVVRPGSHPWIDLMLPMSEASTFLREAQDKIAPIATGDRYNLLLIPLRRSTFTRPLFRTQDEELGVGFDTLRALPAGLDVESVLTFNRDLYDRCRELGGSSYPISAVRLDVSDWRAHCGDQWDRLLDAKRRYDGDDVLASGPDVLGRRWPR